MLAATRLIALHKNKGMTVAACLKNRTDYIENPDKTEQGQFVSSYACSALTADEEFMLTKRQYDLVNGRRQKSDVIAYQIRQSFRPGEITAEEANKVGYELAMRFTKGKYAFVVATHTDRQHIHNHVIFNSTALDVPRGTTFAIVPCTVPKDHCFFDQRYAQKFFVPKASNWR